MLTVFSQINSSNDSTLHSLARQMLQYAAWECPRIDPDIALQKHKLIEFMNHEFERQNAVIRTIGCQMNQILLSQANKRQLLEETIQELSEQVQLKTIDMQNLQEAVTHLENKAISYQTEYGKLKSYSQTLNEKLKQSEKKWHSQLRILTNQNKELKKIVHENINIIQKLKSQKQLLVAQIKQQRANTQKLIHQIQQLSSTIQKQKDLTQQQQQKINQLVKQREKLLAKTQISEQALSLVKQDSSVLFCGNSIQKSISQRPTKIWRHPSGPQMFKLNIKKICWNENLPYNLIDQFQWQKAGPQSRGQPKRGYPDFTCLSLDPYFAHFVLTSQSVKIKQDCQQLLNIDIKPYYGEIVEKRIPMHLWDQWIRNRLRELRRKIRKNTSEFTSQDDQSV